MAARGRRERRAALWPYVVMPLVVLLVFYVLFRVHNPPRARAAPATPPTTAQP
jgi:hypothetical protein